MEIKLKEIKGESIATIASEKTISKVEEFVDILGNANYLGANKIVIEEEQLSPDFFDLKTQFAGELLQKVSNYGMNLTIFGDFANVKSKSLNDFIRESNKAGRVVFINRK